MSRLQSLSANPTLRNFAQDASQSAIRKVANFIAPSVEVPAISGQYKIYDAKHRYKRPITRRSEDGKATRIGFSAKGDPHFNLAPNALDFPIPNAEQLAAGDLLNYAQYGATLLSDAAGLAHEGEVIDMALAAVGAGTNVNFLDDTIDIIDLLDEQIQNTMKLAKNGAGIKVLFGATAYRRTKNNKSVRGRYVSGSGTKFATPGLADIQAMLFGNPQLEMALLVEDIAAEGKAADIQFMLDETIMIFASNDTPNTMDPSFMKTFRLMGQWMVPGTYLSEDERDQVLKFDWFEQIVVTNAPAAVRINAKKAN